MPLNYTIYERSAGHVALKHDAYEVKEGKHKPLTSEQRNFYDLLAQRYNEFHGLTGFTSEAANILPTFSNTCFGKLPGGVKDLIGGYLAGYDEYRAEELASRAGVGAETSSGAYAGAGVGAGSSDDGGWGPEWGIEMTTLNRR